jgi:hypothetical protein
MMTKIAGQLALEDGSFLRRQPGKKTGQRLHAKLRGAAGPVRPAAMDGGEMLE